MIDTATIERYMRDANPIPDIDDVDPDEFARFVAAANTRRAATMQAPNQPQFTPSPPTTALPLRRRRSWAFAVAFIVILATIGIAALALRNNTPPVTDEPAPPTTVAEMPEKPISVDSLTWSRIQFDEALLGGSGIDAVHVRDVTVGGPGVVAVGSTQNAAVWTSPDGYTWSRVDDDSVFGTELFSQIESIAAGGPGLVAVGSQLRWEPVTGPAAMVWTSPDGVTWTRAPDDEVFDLGEMWDVTQVGPGLVAVGSTSERGYNYKAAAAWTSPDGVTWFRAEVPMDPIIGSVQEPGLGDPPPDNAQHAVMSRVTVGGPGLVAVGSSGDNAAVWTSPDGHSWTRIPHDEATFGGPGFQTMSSVTVEGPGLVAVGGDRGRAAVWTSPDGSRWTRIPHDEAIFGGFVNPEWGPDFDPPMHDVVATDSGLFAFGQGIAGVVGDGDPLHQAIAWTSPDGIAWTRIPLDESVSMDDNSSVWIDSATTLGSGLVAVGGDYPNVWVATPTDTDEPATGGSP